MRRLNPNKWLKFCYKVTSNVAVNAVFSIRCWCENLSHYSRLKKYNPLKIHQESCWYIMSYNYKRHCVFFFDNIASGSCNNYVDVCNELMLQHLFERNGLSPRTINKSENKIYVRLYIYIYIYFHGFPLFSYKTLSIKVIVPLSNLYINITISHACMWVLAFSLQWRVRGSKIRKVAGRKVCLHEPG